MTLHGWVEDGTYRCGYHGWRRWLGELVGAVADGSHEVHRVVTAEHSLGDVPSAG